MPRLRPTHTHERERAYLRPGGPWDVPTLDELLRSAGPCPELLVDERVRLSSAEVDDLVARLAGGLRLRGVERGDVVAWQAPNRHESVLLYRACWRLGAIAAPLHHQAGGAELDRMLEQAEPRLLLAARGLPAAERAGARLLEDELPALLDAAPVHEPQAEPADLAAVLFTSGSTAGPKGVLHTHRGLASKARLMVTVHGLHPDDAILMPAPLAHISGLLNAVLNPGVVPMKTVLMERWSPEVALDHVERERITFMIGPPTFFVAMMASPEFSPRRVASIRLLSCGGAGVSPAFVEQAEAAFEATVKRTYGSTEAPTVTTSHAGDNPARARATDGRPTGEVEVRISDPATGEEREAGEVGEVWLRGPELFVGYVDEEETRRAHAPGGWFRTGDLGVVDAEGWLTITGRLKDVIIRGGENISASEVEAIVEAHPVVRQAVAVGEPDERLGERVAVFVVADEPFDLARCRAWFEEQRVARFKTPERVIQVDELPLLAAGKPDRARLRAWLVEGGAPG